MADINKLKASGFYTVAVILYIPGVQDGFPDWRQSVHAATRRTLLKIKGFSEVKVEKIKEAIQKCLVRRNHP